MAHVPPGAILRPLTTAPTPKAPERYKLRIHDIQPEQVVPNGDRYVVEVIDLDDTILLGSILVITQEQGNPNDPMADPTVERRGVIAGVVVRAGNGHLLGLPDLPPVSADQVDNELWSAGDRPWAAVDMFYEPGDVVLIDHNAKGRALKILGKEVRIVNQIDCLAKIEGIRLEKNDAGEWEPVEG